MDTVMLCLVVLLAVLLCLAAGMTWQKLLHWAGELLLVVGVVLAARGIRDVRRQWTALPGVGDSARQKGSVVSNWAVALLWLRWNWATERWPRLARWLRLRSHLTHKNDQEELHVDGETGNIGVAALPGRLTVSGGDAGQQLMQLEAAWGSLRRSLTGFEPAA